MIKNKKAVTLIANSVKNTSRLFKIVEFLTENRRVENIVVIGFWAEDLPTKEDYNEKIRIIRVKTIKQILPKINFKVISKLLTFLSLIPLYFYLTLKSIQEKPDIIYCHDVILIPVALFVKLVNGTTLIYMPHELETEETGTSKMMNKIWKLIEKIGMKYFKHTTVVSPSIQEWYKNEYNTQKVSLIRNIPQFFKNEAKEKKLRSKLGISHNDIVFIYQGLIGESRGVIEIARLFSELTIFTRHIVFMGYGPEEGIIKDYSSKHQNIHFIPAVDQSEIFSYTSDTDIGLIFIPQIVSKSYKYSLPNKYFEYVASGIPVLVSDNLSSIALEAKNNLTGWSIESTTDSLKEFILRITIEAIIEAKNNVKIAEEEYNWNREAQVLLNI